MLYKLGRVLQFVGLLILPIAMAGEIAGSFTEGPMLMWAGLGLGVFALGWLVQQVGKR